MAQRFHRDLQFFKFSTYGFLKNLRFFDPFLVLFFLEKGVGYLEIGTLYAVREIATNLLEVPTGVAADALGRRRTMIASFVAYLASFALFYTGSTMPIFLLAMLLFAGGEALRTGTHKAMIMAYLRMHGWEQEKAYYYGATRSWSQVGAAVSSLLAAAIVFYEGSYAPVFLFSGIPYMLDLLLLLTYPKELDGQTSRLSGAAIADGFKRTFGALLELARRKESARTLVNVSLFAGFHKGAKDFLQPMVQALALSLPLFVAVGATERTALVIGAAYAALYLLTAAASRFSGSAAAALKSPQRALDVEIAAGLGCGVLLGVFYLFGLSGVAVGLFFCVYIVHNLRRPVSVSVMSDAAPDDLQATVLSVESQAASLFAALFAFAIGAIADAAGGNVGWGLLAVSAFAAAGLPFYRASRRQ